jgi:hypothetical protein
MVRVPVRVAPVLLATVKPTTPFPVPLAPDVTVIKLALLDAAQPHPDVVMTFTVPEPPLAPKVWLFEDSEKLHVTPGVTVKVKGVVS